MIKVDKNFVQYSGSGEFRIRVGMGTCGLAAGADQVFEALKENIKKMEIRGTIVPVGCSGTCYLEPQIEISREGYPSAIYGNVNAANLPSILRSYLSGSVEGAVALREKLGVMKGEENVPLFDELDFNKHQIKRVTINCGKIDPESIDDYIATGGFTGLKKALSMKPEEVIDVVKASGLRGRGGAGFPTYLKWLICRQAVSEKKFVVCNADEGDPGAFMNRMEAESDPYRVVEGLITAGYAIGAHEGFFFVRAEKPLMALRLRKAVEEARKRGFLGENILGSGFAFDVQVILSAGAFVCGEETAMIAAIEGRRAMPRQRPPFPATKGLWDYPTNINNVETLAQVPVIFQLGPSKYSEVGSEKSKGTKVFCIAGKVRRTGAAEVPIGTPIRKLVFDIGGGVYEGRKFKAVQTGGPSGGCLPEKFLDLPLDYESLQAAGSIMGSGGIIVLDDEVCTVDIAKYFLTFTSAESCGKCTPCRVGTKVMLSILTRISEGDGEMGDLEKLRKLAESMRDTALCALGQGAPNPVITTLRYFEDEYVAHIRDKVCPAGVCPISKKVK